MADSETDRQLVAKRAELKLLESEDKFRKAKAAGKLTTKMKDDLRAQRAAYRAEHRLPKVGGQPATIATKVGGGS